MIYNLWWLLKYLIEKKDNEKKSAKHPTGGTVPVKGLITFIYIYVLIKFYFNKECIFIQLN